MMKLHDVSLPLSPELPTWPGDPAFKRELASAIARGAPANVSRLDFGAHTGTHVDAPVHFIEGASGIEMIPVDTLVGACRVIEVDPPGTELRPQDLPEGDFDRVLFKTRNSERWAARDNQFDRDFVAVGKELAEELVARKVRLVGVDYLSVEPFDTPAAHPVHHLLLAAGIAVIEGLDLSQVDAGDYELYCLPLKLVGSDGAPARVLLVDRDS
jgi:arylformamidase